eukprot:8129798-Pyramimonas_sp.AAC.1
MPSPLARLAPAPGICSLLSPDWFRLRNGVAGVDDTRDRARLAPAPGICSLMLTRLVLAGGGQVPVAHGGPPQHAAGCGGGGGGGEGLPTGAALVRQHVRRGHRWAHEKRKPKNESKNI